MSDDHISEFYQDRHIFYTGATGLVGTAYLSRLLLDTPVARVYAIVRGGENRLWKVWQKLLPADVVQTIRRSQKLIVFDGDITRPNFGLSAESLKTICDNVSIFIHGASPIHLKMSLSDLVPKVTNPSLALAKIALGCDQLTHFVFISTAYTNAFLRRSEDGSLYAADATVKEDIIPICENSKMTARGEFSALKKYGTTPEYESVQHPFPYSYAKHLTERLMLETFQEAGSENKLMIFRPSCIGPAVSKPYSFFEVPGSSPITSLMANVITAPPIVFTAANYLPNASESTIDEVPVDVVVNRLVAHVAFNSNGCVHAVAGGRDRHNLEALFDNITKLRHPRRGSPKIGWSRDSSKQSTLARLFMVSGTSFLFEDTKTDHVWQQMTALERSKWPLRSTVDISSIEYLQGRQKMVTLLMNGLLLKDYRL